MTEEATKKFYRSTSDRWIAGVCGGLAKYFGIDPVLMRILWIVGSLVTAVLGGVVAYVLIWALTEER